jgi:hypothetical protein
MGFGLFFLGGPGGGGGIVYRPGLDHKTFRLWFGIFVRSRFFEPNERYHILLNKYCSVDTASHTEADSDSHREADSDSHTVPDI